MQGLKPVRVTIHLRGPMVKNDQPIHLDALLAAMRVKEAEAEHGAGINPRDFHHDLPLDKHTDAGGWVFKASALEPADILNRETYMQTSRLSIEEASEDRASGYLALRSAKPNPAGGHFKTSLYHLPTLTTSKLVGYAVGDVQGIEQLLSRCHQVGGRRGVGFGQVGQIDVEPVELDECYWQNRNMPLDDTGKAPAGYVLALASLVPPYWDKSQYQEVLVPDTMAL